MSLDAEVIIVGGGLAGCATALNLARYGHEVLVLERSPSGTDKVCGEGLMPHGLAALSRLGVKPPPDARPFYGITWTIDGISAKGRFPGVHGLGVRRRDLDAAMLDAATKAPRVEVRRGHCATSLQRAQTVAVTTDAGTLRARIVIGADGMRSSVRRWAGLEAPAHPRMRYGLRGHTTLAPGVADPSHVQVEMLDRAELYVTPVGPGEVNVAILCEADAAKDLKGDRAGTFARWLATSHLASLLQVPPDDVRATGPLRHAATEVVSDGVLLVGDAAGFIDGITGEGMATALVSAESAAKVVSDALHGGRTDAAALAPYARARRKQVRDTDWLTEIILWGLPHRWLVRRMVHKLAAHPDLFERLLAIESGQAEISSLGLRWLWLATP